MLGISMTEITGSLAEVALLTTAGASLLGYLSRYGWIFELISHFRVQYAAILGLGAVLMWLSGELLLAVLLAVVGMINLLPVSPFLPVNRSAEADGFLKLILINVRMRNRAFEHVERLLEHEAPDLIGLVEVDEGWLRAVGPLLEQNGYSTVASPSNDSYGLAVYSKFRIASRSPAELDGLDGSSLICTVSINKQRLNLLLVHLPPPLTPRFLQLRDRALEDIGDWLRGSTGEWIVMGDFNVTPWSPRLRGVCKQANLRSFRENEGVRATWPDQFAPFRIPIDHVLGTNGVSFGRSEVGPSVRSDHLPLIVHFRLQDQ